MQIIMDHSKVEVGTGPDGTRIMQITDMKAGIVVIVPMTPEGARTVGAALSTALVVAGASLPKVPGNGHR